VLRLFCQSQFFNVRDVKFAAGNGLDQGAGSLSGRVAAVSFLRAHHHIHQPHPQAYQYDYGNRGEKVDAHAITEIIIAFGSCFPIDDIPLGARVAPCTADGTVLRKCGDGYHEFTPDLSALIQLNGIYINYLRFHSEAR
jgi:hypothetical protein